MTEKMYPTLPTAPHEGSLERYNRVKDIYNELQTMKTKRHNSYKKYGKATSILQNTTITLSSIAAAEATAGIVTSLTVIGIPIGLILGGVAGITGLTAAILTPIAKHCEKKKLKHAKLHTVLSTSLTVLDKKISKHLNDNVVDDQEFQDFLGEYEKVKEMIYANDINKLKDDVKKEITNSIKKTFIIT